MSVSGAASAAAASTAAGPIAEYEAIIVGAGLSGMYMLIRLRELGMRVRVFEAGSDVGGTWYWNRYPGARFDSESWSYGFFFDDDLYQEWDWPEHFAAQPDTLRYLNHVADRFDLRRDMEFDAEVQAAHFDDARNDWTITLADGRQARAPLLITGLGPLSAPTMPVIPGVETYEGACCHTARWPHEPVDFRGKRVGIIGTGATAIQTIQTIAPEVGHLTVFQRSPNWAAPLNNSRITPEEQRKIKASARDIHERCFNTISCFIHNADPRKALETPPEEREAFWEKLYNEPGFGIWMGNFSDILVNEEANKLVTEFMAKKIRERVKDPKVADLLTPKNHGFGTRRVPLESGYYEVYNRDNVLLVDINATPIERITPKGVKTTEKEYEFDFLIYATGFDGVTGPYDRIDIRGAGGRSLREEWAEELPRTYLGVQVEGYPNLLMILGPHTARGNIPRNSEQIVDFLAGLVRHMRENGLKRVETRPEHVDEWQDHVERAAAPLLSSKVKSWQTGVNRNVAGRDVLRVLGYNGSAVKYRKTTERVAEGGYKEFQFE